MSECRSWLLHQPFLRRYAVSGSLLVPLHTICLCFCPIEHFEEGICTLFVIPMVIFIEIFEILFLEWTSECKNCRFRIVFKIVARDSLKFFSQTPLFWHWYGNFPWNIWENIFKFYQWTRACQSCRFRIVLKNRCARLFELFSQTPLLWLWYGNFHWNIWEIIFKL